MSKARSQSWNPAEYSRNARFVSELGMPVVELLAPRPGERVLDLGCGDGALTVKLIEAGCDVLAVDSSAEMVAAAQALGIDARVMDGAALDFDAEFDAVFSNAALHWMQEHTAVAQGIARALRPGGRLVAEFGGFGNVGAIETQLQAALARRGLPTESPWYFPQPDEYRRELEGAALRVELLEHFPRPTPLPGDMTAWLGTFGKIYLAPATARQQAAIIAEVRDALRPQLIDADGHWFVDYVRLRVRANKPGSEG